MDQLTISLPNTGIYALVDHAQRHERGKDGKARDFSGNVFGFRSIHLKLQNATLDNRLIDGTLWVLASYQLNHCYQPDLSGELKFGQHEISLPEKRTFSNCSGMRYVSGSDHLSVSKEVKVGDRSLVEISRASPVALAFDFSADPIPVNARDLSLKVIYRGRLGTTKSVASSLGAEDAFAIGVRDISEPSYLSIRNWTDVQTNGKFEIKRQKSGFPNVKDFRFKVNGIELFRIASVPGYAYARIVYLSDYARNDNVQVEWRDGNNRAVRKAGVLAPSMIQWVNGGRHHGNRTFAYQQFWGVRNTYHSKQVLLRRDDMLIAGDPQRINWEKRKDFALLQHPDPIAVILCVPVSSYCASH